jgi:hypothetical protein
MRLLAKQKGLTIGRLFIWLLVISMTAVLVEYGYSQYKRNEFISVLESYLTDAKIRVNSALAEQDRTATYNDLLEQYEVHANEIGKSIIAVRKLEGQSSRQHYDRSLAILTAARDAIRAQRQVAAAHVRGVAIMASINRVDENLTGGEIKSSLMNNYKDEVDDFGDALDKASELRIKSLEDLIAATEAASGIFSDRALIDVDAYSNSIELLRQMNEQ